MCVAMLQNALRTAGRQTHVRFAPVSAAAEELKKLLPYGRAAVFADAGFLHLAAVRAQLAEYRPVCAVLGEEIPAGLLALPDEVRAVVALGKNSIFAARFFATLRGGAVLAVPLAPSAEGIAERALPRKFFRAGYPLRDADAVLVDGSLFSGVPAAFGFAALSLLCAEDCALDALFSGREEDPAFVRAAEAFAAFAEEPQGLFCADALLRLALDLAPPLPAAEAAACLGGDAFPLFACFAARYARFLEHAQPRASYVADYVGRALCAAERTGRAAAELLRNIRVPNEEECARRIRVFAEAREKLRVRGQLLRAAAGKAARRYAAFGGKTEEGEEAALYECAAELSPLLSVPALEREFGLLGDVPRGAASAARMRAACG